MRAATEHTDVEDRGAAVLAPPPSRGSLDEASLPWVARRYERVLNEIDRRGPALVRERVQASVDASGARFRTASGDQRFRVDPVPRLVSAEEWALLARGLKQRARALEAFVRDAYGEQRIVRSGVVPAHLLATSRLFEAELRGVSVPGDTYVHIYGPDLVRASDGRLRVLEDNMRTPSGITYVLALRRVLERELADEIAGVEPLEHLFEWMREAFALAAPDAAAGEPEVVVLTDGERSPAFWEHREVARVLDIALVTSRDLEVRGGRLVRRDERGASVHVDVVYRRTDDAAWSAADGGRSPLAELLGEPVRSGAVGIANAFGTGIGDDKLTHAYVEAMIRFYLDEQPLLSSVRTLDLGVEAEREEALARLDELVVKERHRAGGAGVVLEPELAAGGADSLAGEIAARGPQLVAQERVALSTHPTVCDDGLEPRRVDLRPYVIRARHGWRVVPGGLTRYAADPDELVVNSTQGGGGKDTWILS